jgi:tetratricopeptide (TPR) repeat protein
VTESCKRSLIFSPRVALSRFPLFLCWLLVLNASVCLRADSRQALQNAASLVQQGKLDEADRQAQLAISDPATHAVACSVLGTIRFQQKRLPESVNYLQEAIRLDPRLVGARLSLAEVYTMQGKPALALPLYRRVLELDTSNTTARLALVRAEAENGHYKESLAFARPILADLKQSTGGLTVLALDYLKTGNRDAAADLANEWVRLPSASTDESINFALLLTRDRVVPEAIDVLEHARRSGPLTYELAFNLAGAYLLNGSLSLSLKNYDAALSLNPESVPALRQAAAAAEKNGSLERALSYWMRAKKLEPENPEILLGFGRVCLKMDLLDDSEPALTKAAALKPDDLVYQYTLASAKVGKKQYEAAQSLFEKILEKKPQDSQVQYALGSVLYLEGRLAEATARFVESVRLQPYQLASNYYLALIARDQGNEPEAMDRLEKLLQRYPEHGPSREALGELLMSAKRYPEAESNLQRAVQLNPNSVKANYQLGLLLSRMGKKQEADKQFEIAKNLRTEDESNSRLQLRLLDPEQ